MAKLYAKQQVGVLDGSQKPPRQADGHEVNGTKRSLLATKVTGTNWAIGDQVSLGKIPSGRKVVGVRCCSDTSLGTSTVSIGTAADPVKYVNAKTFTTVDAPGLLGPKASAMALDPTTVEEEILATIGVAAVPGAVVLTFEIETSGI
jgi:hypothetical protein